MNNTGFIPKGFYEKNILSLKDVLPKFDKDKKRFFDNLSLGAWLLRNAVFEGMSLSRHDESIENIEYEITQDGRYRVTKCDPCLENLLAVLVFNYENGH